jgi:hypothetical protein
MCIHSASSGVKLSNETKLAFYTLFKQATDGPCTEKAPSRLKVIEYAKWKGWSALGKYVLSPFSRASGLLNHCHWWNFF